VGMPAGEPAGAKGRAAWGSPGQILSGSLVSGSLRRVAALVAEAELASVPRRIVRRVSQVSGRSPAPAGSETSSGRGTEGKGKTRILVARKPAPETLFPRWLREGLKNEALGEARPPPGPARIAVETGLWYVTLAAGAAVALPCAFVFCLATLGVGLAVRLWGCARKSEHWRFLRASRARKLELLKRICQQFGAESLWIEVPDPVTGAVLRVHIARMRFCGPLGGKRGSALFLHGLNSTSLMFAEAMQACRACYDCYALDLPGFGLTEGPAHVRYLDGPHLLDWYAGVVRNSAVALGLSPPAGGRDDGRCEDGGEGEERILVGHSMGAMFSIRAASGSNIPGLFTRLELVAPPGLVPILGEMASFLGLKIRLNFPEGVFQYFGCVLCPVVNFWQTWRESGDLALFRFQRYSDRAAFGSGLVRRLNRFSWAGYSTWHVTTMAELFRLEPPFRLTYGERDLLVPPDQGELLVRMARNKMPCAVVLGAGHGLFLSDPDKMAALILEAPAEGVPATSRAVFSELARIVEPIDPLRYRVSLSRSHARCVIRKLYWGLLEATGASSQADNITYV